MVVLVLVCLAGWILSASFDVWWFVRLLCTITVSKLFRSRPERIMDGTEMYSICSTTDVDYFFHMNNGRYLRELDFARFDYYYRFGIVDYMKRSAPDSYFVVNSSTIRYRRSLAFLMPFKVVTRLLYFDDRSMYLEQKFVSLKDNFVRAIALVKNTAVNLDVKKMMLEEYNQPELQCPLELQKFIECNEVSSNNLRLSGVPGSVGNALCEAADQLDKKAA